MRAARANPAGTDINLQWDASTCTAQDYNVLYGSLANVASYALDRYACALGTSGLAAWNAVPAGNLWFVVTAQNGSGTESSWGRASSGAERNGTTASGQCGNATVAIALKYKGITKKPAPGTVNYTYARKALAQLKAAGVNTTGTGFKAVVVKVTAGGK
jgi:hypothetical protein